MSRCVLLVLHRGLWRSWRGGRSRRCGTRRIYMCVFSSVGESRGRVVARTRGRRGRLLWRCRLALYSLQLPRSTWHGRRRRHSPTRAGRRRNTIRCRPRSGRGWWRRRCSPMPGASSAHDASSTSIHWWHGRGRQYWSRRSRLFIIFFFQKFHDEVLVLLNEIIRKALLRQEVSKVFPPVRIICLQFGKLGGGLQVAA